MTSGTGASTAAALTLLLLGGNDYHDIVQESKANGVQYPRKLRTLNIKTMAMILRNAFPGRKVRGGLRNTLETFGLSFIGRQHRALPDAENTAKLVSYIFNNFKLAETVKGLVKHDT
jgi:inhibitor of KinA sporulation pathway (predicted exonuclease)